MGKKNKNSKQNNLETVAQKGGSAISKAKTQANLKGKAKGVENKKPINVKSKVVDEKKLEDVGLKLNEKKKKGNISNGEKKKQDTTPTKQKTAAPPQENGNNKDEKIVKLSKREKNRVKSKMSKDIAMGGKSKLGLADPKLVARQLSKLKASESLSKAKQKKLLLLEKLHKKLQKESGNKTPNTTLNSESDDGNTEADTSNASVSSKPKAGGAKKGKSDSRKEKDKLFLFVGNLPADVTDDMIREVFKSVGNLEKVKIPVPKRKKSKRFAYIKLGDEESKQKALQLHGAMIGERKITVLYSDKSKGKSGLVSVNAKLNAERKAAAGKVNAPNVNGSPNKSNKKNKNKKNKKGKGVAA